MDTLGIYVQVPFCASKCTFCNFSSRVAPAIVFDGYCDALQNETQSLRSCYAKAGVSENLHDLEVDTVYFGGGTPSLLGFERLKRIIGVLRRNFQFNDCPEFTIEVTPGSVDESFCERALALGINRLSIGAQSFADGELRSTGRLHSSEETQVLVRWARRAGFSNISLDLIAGLPFQTEASWLHSLNAALELKPEHLSIYLFEIDEKSRLGAEVLREGDRYHASDVPGDEFMADAYEAAGQILVRTGYIQYEISNFALPGRESRHNRKYWQLLPYVGLGAGAHSFDGEHRWANEIGVERYEEKVSRGESPIASVKVLSSAEQLEEFFFLGLRQTEGIDLNWARRHWGLAALQNWEPKLALLAQNGWIERRADRVYIPERAFLISNEIFQEFLQV